MTNDTIPFVVNAVVNVPFCLITILGNSLVLVSFARTPSLLSPSNLLLICLAISDLWVGLITQPLYIAWKFHQHMHPTQTMSTKFLEKLFYFSSQLSSGSSFLIVSTLSVDRFLAIHLHLRYREIVTLRRVTCFICFPILGFPMVLASLDLWRPGSFEIISMPFCYIGFLVNAVLYFKIYRVVRRHQLQISHQRPLPFATATVNTAVNNNVQLKISFFTSLYLYLVFAFCYVPYLCIAFRIIMEENYEMGSRESSGLAFELSWTIVYINSSLNPVLFAWRINNIRTAVKNTLSDILRK